MQSQMLGNGVAFADGAAGAGAGRDARVNQKAFDLKLKNEHARIRDEYESKIRELEADRQEAEQGRAQVGRYKAVLLKQRDIMIALTARLNERDETIIRMQEELKAYDGEYRRVEDALDAKTAELIALRRAAMRHSAESPGARNDELVAALGGWAGDKENPQNLLSASGDETPRRPFGVGATEVRDDASDSSLVSELESTRGELRAKSAELERLRAEVSVASAQSRAARGASPPASPARKSAPDDASAEKVSAQYREFRREMAARLEEKNGRVLFLEDECARLKRALADTRGFGGDGDSAPPLGLREPSLEGAETKDPKAARAALAEKVAGFARERVALKTILENKIQSLVSGVNRSVDALGADADQKAPRLRREVRALERLVAATVQAMDH
jgi:kinesin family protein 3/17